MSNGVSRRTLLAGAAVVGGTVAGGVVNGTPALAAADPFAPVTVTPTDPRYPDLVRNWNARFVGRPEYIRVAGTPAHVESAVSEAVSSGKRLVVRSGGHCLEGFVGDPTVQVLLDVGQMADIHVDTGKRAFVIEPGTPLREMNRTLYTRWGVTLPGGNCPSVAAGGHFMGGGYGPLARRYGATSDHLWAVDVVTVNAAGRAKSVFATREALDPNRELFWAHTGGGGGNFGVVTKYYFRSRGATGTDPAGWLPKPLKAVRLLRFGWTWSDLTQGAFLRLTRAYQAWYATHSAPNTPYSRITADLFLPHQSAGSPYMFVAVDPSEADSASLLADFRAAVVDTVGVPMTTSDFTVPWLTSTNLLGYPDVGNEVLRRSKNRTAYLRTGYTEAQLSTMHSYLTRPGYTIPSGQVWFAGYGAQANALAPGDTALPQRDSALKVLFTASWASPAEDALHLAWVREMYRDVHSATGGVPEINGATDGAYINYADVDLADPAWNTSSIPWYTLYYKGNYPRLQRVKAIWDPLNVFRHALSVRP